MDTWENKASAVTPLLEASFPEMFKCSVLLLFSNFLSPEGLGISNLAFLPFFLISRLHFIKHTSFQDQTLAYIIRIPVQTKFKMYS